MRSISSGSRPVSAATSSTVTCSSGSEKSSSAKPKASRPSRPAFFRSSSEWPRSRIRATTRAWAAAAAVQRPRRTGTTFSSAQRLSVLAETPERRAASLRDMRSSPAIEQSRG